MRASDLDWGLIEKWQSAASDLHIRMTAPVELRDAQDNPFVCEVFVHDFGSPIGGIVVSQKTERRVRSNLRQMDPRPWITRAGRSEARKYNRLHLIEELVDWGWFGPPDKMPGWYSERRHPASCR